MAGDWTQFPHHWLMEKCPSYSKPFDLPQDLMAKLLKLEEINKQRDFDADQVIEVLKQIDAEYTAIVSQSQKIVDKVKGPYAELKKIAKCERIPPSFHAQLEEKRTFLSDIEKKHNNIQLSREKMRLKKECLHFDKKTADCLIKIKNLERELEKAKDEIEEKKRKLSKEETDLDEEIIKAERTLEELEEKLEGMGLTEDMYPEVLVREMKELDKLKEKKQEMITSLAEYQDLPPNLLEAKKVIRELKREEAKLQQKISNITG